MTHTTQPVPALELVGVSKAFPGVQALAGASLRVRPGEVHGLVGENGAGKSTIIKVLAGVYRADQGSVTIDGRPVDPPTPRLVHQLGVRFIHQELSLVPHFTVAESVFMGQEVVGRLGLSQRQMRRRAEALLEETLRTRLSGRTLIRDLSVAQRKLVQIARALIDGRARSVVFDEPTAALGRADIDTLFVALRGLRETGIAVVYVSHYLSEITEICDRVTVFRNGRDVGVLDVAPDTDTREMIRLMVGRDISALYPSRVADPGEVVLDVAGLGDGSQFRDVTFSLRAGEIVGLAGIIGSGREELVDALAGVHRSRSGTMRLEGRLLRARRPADAVGRGLVLVPRDRRNDGLVLGMTVADNVNLATLGEVSTAGWVRGRTALARSDALVERLDVRPRRSQAVVRTLSGGNQQKVVLARWLASGAKVFVLDDPTVGVDINARSEIYALIASLARDRAAVLISSNDLGELIGMCDRVMVMVRGELVAVRPAAGLTLDELVTLTTSSANGNGSAGPAPDTRDPSAGGVE